MKVQIIGRITENPDYVEQFAAAAQALRDLGHEVWNPVERVPQDIEYEEQMALCLSELSKQDAICRISGWRNSEGAAREYARAAQLGLAVLDAELEEEFCIAKAVRAKIRETKV